MKPMENLFRFRVQAQTDRLDAPSELRKQRRLIARIRTIQTEQASSACGNRSMNRCPNCHEAESR